MRFLLKRAWRGFLAGSKKHARMWSTQLETWQKSVKERGGEIVDVQPLTNLDGKIRFFLLKINDKAGKQ